MVTHGQIPRPGQIIDWHGVQVEVLAVDAHTQLATVQLVYVECGLPEGWRVRVADYQQPTAEVATHAKAVLLDDFDAWQAALIRAQEHHLSACSDDDSHTPSWVVSSYSQPGLGHEVRLGWDIDGTLMVTCDCEAASHGNICQHAALAIDRAAAWPFPIARQTELL